VPGLVSPAVLTYNAVEFHCRPPGKDDLTGWPIFGGQITIVRLPRRDPAWPAEARFFAMDMTIDCPHCGTPLRVPESAAGRRGRCTECDQRFAIPSMQELLESTVSHFMVASIEAADDTEDAFEDALEDSGYRSASGGLDQSEGTVAGIPVAAAHRSDDSQGPITTDTLGRADNASADADDEPSDADLIDISRDMQQDDLLEDAMSDTPVPESAIEDDQFESAPPPPESSRYPTALRPAEPRPYLVVRGVGIEGVRLAFDGQWLKHETFRISMPMRCVFSGDDESQSLIARAIIFHNKHVGVETPLHSLETQHELHVASNPSPRDIVRAMGRLDDFKEPFDRPLLYFVSQKAASNSLEATAHTMSGGAIACEVMIPHHRTALEWVERVNGRCGPEFAMLEADIVRYASDAWRALPDRVRHRIGVWCRFERGELFKLYLNDADFTHNDAGLAGVVVTNRRLIYHKFRRSRSISLNQDAVLHVATDAKVARLTLQSMGRAARCGKIHRNEVSQLIDALSDAPKLRVEVRKGHAPTNAD